MSVRTDMINVLRSPTCRRIDFTLAGVHVSGAEYATIAQCIVNGHIQVVQSSLVPATMAAYDRKYNYFVVGSSPSPNLIVHEGTHALNDWHKRSISDVEDEACAYIAQAFYLLIENPRLRTALEQPGPIGPAQEASRVLQQCRTSGAPWFPWIDPKICNTAAIQQAGYLALDLLNGRAMSASTLQDLRFALDHDPHTHIGTSNVRTYDGILRTAIPSSRLQGAHLVTN